MVLRSIFLASLAATIVLAGAANAFAFVAL